MMKTLKRMMSGILAVLLLVCLMAVPASAAKITINNAATNHVYEAYQIFGGTLEGETLSNIVWGTGIDTSYYDEETQIFGKTGEQTPFDGKTAKDVAGTLSEETHAIAFAEAIAPYLAANATKTVNTQTDSAYVLDELAPGYYLIKDKDESQNNLNDSYTRYIVQILGDVTIDPKSGIPTFSKGISKDVASKFENYKEAVSASIGDTVYYALTASMHSNIRDYTNCYYQIVDTLPTALTFDKDTDILGVYVVNGSLQEEIPETYYNLSHDSGTNTLTVTFKDIHAAIYAVTGTSTAVQDKIVVSYQAKLNSNVILGKDEAPDDGLLDSNQNTAVLYYSNNPNEAYDAANYDANNDAATRPTSLGKTANATANVYSYILKLYKIDAVKDENKDIPLEGAEFKMHVLENGITPKYMTFDTDGKFTGFVATEDAATVLKTDGNGYITVQGLASGTYHFEETGAPAGYNTLTKEIQVTIEGKLDATTGQFNGFEASQDGGATVSADKETGTAIVTVTNHRGSILPSTGGMGTTIFYVVGIVLVAGAATVLFAKKRAERN